jgi:chaperonin cofactor prefoldin
VAAATTRLTTEINATVTKEVGAKLLAEWKGKVDVELERAEALSVRLKLSNADLKAAEEKQAALESEIMATKMVTVKYAPSCMH